MLFLKLKDVCTLEASNPVSNKDFQNFVKSNKNKINQLKVNRNGNGKNKKFRKKKFCDCGEEGQKFMVMM